PNPNVAASASENGPRGEMVNDEVVSGSLDSAGVGIGSPSLEKGCELILPGGGDIPGAPPPRSGVGGQGGGDVVRQRAGVDEQGPGHLADPGTERGQQVFGVPPRGHLVGAEPGFDVLAETAGGAAGAPPSGRPAGAGAGGRR